MSRIQRRRIMGVRRGRKIAKKQKAKWAYQIQRFERSIDK